MPHLLRIEYRCPACGYDWAEIYECACDSECACGCRNIIPTVATLLTSATDPPCVDRVNGEPAWP